MSPFESTLKGLPIRHPSPGYVERVLAQRPRPHAPGKPWWLRGRPLQLVAAAALGACLAVAVYWLGAAPGNPRPEVARNPETAVAPDDSQAELQDDGAQPTYDLNDAAETAAGQVSSETLDGAPSSADSTPTVSPDDTAAPGERGGGMAAGGRGGGMAAGRRGGGMATGGRGGMAAGGRSGGMQAPGPGAGPGQGGFGGRMGAGGMGVGMPLPGRGDLQRDTEPAELGQYNDAATGALGIGARGAPAPGNRDLFFAEGLSVRRTPGPGPVWGYVNYANQWVIEPNYQIAGDFSSGIAQVQIRYDQPAYYIDFRGRRVDDELVARIQAGLVRVQRDGKWGFLDPRTGEMAIEAKYDAAWDFSEGLACVLLRSATPQYRWIDYAGDEAIVLPEVRQGGSFHEGLAPVAAAVTSSGGDAGRTRYGFIDRSGKLAVEPQYDAVYHFSEGRAMVRVGRKFGYIDLAGKLVIPAEFDAGMAFSEGLAGVRVAPEIRQRAFAAENPTGGGWGFIDPSGEFVFPPDYLSVTPFSHGVSFVKYLTPAFLEWDGQGERPEIEEWQSFIDHAGNKVLDVTRRR